MRAAAELVRGHARRARIARPHSFAVRMAAGLYALPSGMGGVEMHERMRLWEKEEQMNRQAAKNAKEEASSALILAPLAFWRLS